MYFSTYLEVSPYLESREWNKLERIINNSVERYGAIFPYDWGESEEHYDLSECKSAHFILNIFEPMDVHAVPLKPNDLRFIHYTPEPKYQIMFWPRSDEDLSEHIPNYDPAMYLLGYDLRLNGYPIEPNFEVYVRESYLEAPHMKKIKDEYIRRKLSI